MNSIYRLLLEGISVGLVVGSVAVAIAIWRGWVPNFFLKDEWHETKDEGR